ncbi:alpha/beta hydrolase [Luteolibacter pohnpeiensis]|uniref:Alpha/beta hydrolase n=1 Tax=Luteolibacter pohnpeiensis TaxID=454153 RepID=A0A934S772_9BACT|nr:alpha/beta hydrolase [Luteolibacter pohnpeiensis]MBK1882540.1 alpha/beta hydrolase [Luteolibacter pohnpeiensis]
MTESSGSLSYMRALPPLSGPSFWHSKSGLKIAWNEFGDPAASGGTLMFYHGWPSSRVQGRVLHHLAAERGIRLIAMDRPGIGQSTLVPSRKLKDWGNLVEEFADALGIDRFAQLAVSGGGPYVLPVAMQIPERVAGSAVLCGAVPLGPGFSHLGLHPAYRLLIPLRKMPSLVFNPGLRFGNAITRLPVTIPPLSWMIRTLPRADRRILLENPDIVPILTASFRDAIHQGWRGIRSDAEIYLQNWQLDWPALQSEIRYWHGAQDRNIPLGLVRKMVALLPNAILNEELHEGHFSIALNRAPQAMDYLAQCLRRPSPREQLCETR